MMEKQKEMIEEMNIMLRELQKLMQIMKLKEQEVMIKVFIHLLRYVLSVAIFIKLLNIITIVALHLSLWNVFI